MRLCTGQLSPSSSWTSWLLDAHAHHDQGRQLTACTGSASNQRLTITVAQTGHNTSSMQARSLSQVSI